MIPSVQEGSILDMRCIDSVAIEILGDDALIETIAGHKVVV
jgi:hypothetical protein